MKPKIEITNMPELQAAFREYAKFTKRGIAEDINQKSYNISISAYSLTRIADKNQIKDLFAPTGTKVVGHKVRHVKVRITKKEALGA